MNGTKQILKSFSIVDLQLLKGRAFKFKANCPRVSSSTYELASEATKLFVTKIYKSSKSRYSTIYYSNVF